MALISFEQIRQFLESEDFELQPTQRKLCLPILQRIYHKMNVGVEFDSINIVDNLLINGHHRYICALLLKKTLQRATWSRPSQVLTYKWPEIQIDLNDWESVDIIERHNMKDAAISGLDIKILEI